MEQLREQIKAFLTEKVAQVEASKRVSLQERQRVYFANEIQPKIDELIVKKDEAIANVRARAEREVESINDATQKAIEELTAKSTATIEAMYGGEFDKEIALYNKLAKELGE